MRGIAYTLQGHVLWYGKLDLSDDSTYYITPELERDSPAPRLARESFSAFLRLYAVRLDSFMRCYIQDA